MKVYPKLTDDDIGPGDIMRKPKRVDTGRIISTRPALQDLPLRTDEGRRIRDALQPTRDVLADMDYTSLEIRLLVAMKGSN